MLSREISFRQYLRKDPTRFLLDGDADPSVYLWYLIDIAHRPENSVAVRAARERVLYSTPVQEIFAAQKPEGYWESPESPAEPRFRATLWTLALMAELGIPRESRRARAACEFMLQSFLEESGSFEGLSAVEAGYLIHALAYFNLARDERVLRGARRLMQEAAADDANVVALWACCELADDAEIAGASSKLCEKVLDSITTRSPDNFGAITFPPFNPRDELFCLRVLALYDRVHDSRAALPVERVMAKQNELSQWPLEQSLNGSLVTTLEAETNASRWATLNALRVIVKLVLRAEG